MLLAEKLFMQSADSSEAQWLMESAQSFFELPVTELPEHISEDQYGLGKAVLERMQKK